MENIPIIEVKNLSKRYDIMHQRGRYVTLRDVLTNVFKSPFSFLKSKAKKAIGLEKKEEFWALKDVSFNVMPGEVIGIIGANGAGKSTLLKILTGITPPTEGEAIMRGRVSSLLEVGTGFHPELTGRENIFLNGAILGMTRKEIAQRFDEIVEFSGVEKFLDTPVKHYSSGMQVRLAFSVAAHMEPDILIVDEVLAVGDAEFQKKCMGKMEEVTTKDGRTILFVSHNMAAIQQLCHRSILLEGGKVKTIGPTKEVTDVYLQLYNGANKSLGERTDRRGTGRVIFKNYEVTKNDHKNRKVEIKISCFNKTDEVISDIQLSVDIVDCDGVYLCNMINTVLDEKIDLPPGENTLYLMIENINLETGEYYLDFSLATDHDKNYEILDWVRHVGNLVINNDFFYKTGRLSPFKRKILLDFKLESQH
jgi:lipopolysaccharide transport system ATP-binding protein